jgi:NifU-like protein involved in Fe-S cluster formation
MLTEATESKSLNQIEDLNRLFRNMMRMDSPSVTHVGDIAALQKIRQFPIRIKCVLLPWTALVEGITEFRARRIAGSD